MKSIKRFLNSLCLGLLVCLVTSLALLASPFASAADNGQMEEIDENVPGVFGLGWLDQTQSFASDSANALANQLDRFFGVQRSDIEAAYSALRVTATESWNDIDDFDSGLRLRGKVHLPRINERISLIFSEEDGDGTSYYSGNNASVAQQETTRVNLEINLADEKAHRLFFRVGLRSGLKGRVSMRYRYEPVTQGNTINRFTQSFYFKDGDGFGSFSRYQLDHVLNEESLIRWTNDVRFEESFTGSEYTSSLEFLQFRSSQTAMSWYARVNGETSPGFVANYDLGVRIRKNISREWLFLELEPGYTWRKQAYNIAREGTPYIVLRLEMAIGTFN